MPPPPAVEIPLAGSQPSSTAKRRINSRASQKLGIEMPAKAKKLTVASSHELGRRAAAIPSASASEKANIKLVPINSSELTRRGRTVASTGSEKRRE